MTPPQGRLGRSRLRGCCSAVTMQSHRILRHFLDQQSFGDCAAGGAPGGGRAFSAAALASFSSDFPMGGLSPPWTPCAAQLTLRAPSTPCASWARHRLGSLSATEWLRIRLLEWASHLRLLQMVDCTPKRAIWPSSTGSDSGADSGTESAAEAAAAAGKVVEKPAADGKRRSSPGTCWSGWRAATQLGRPAATLPAARAMASAATPTRRSPRARPRTAMPRRSRASVAISLSR